MYSEPLTHRRYLSLLLSAGLGTALLALGLAWMGHTAYAQTGSIEGTVTYYGEASGSLTIWVSVYTTTVQPLPPPVASAPVSSPQDNYGFAGLTDQTYYVYAYLDLDGSGGAPDVDEPFAWHDAEGDGTPDPVLVSGGLTAGIDIALSDPWQPLSGLGVQVNALATHPSISGTLYAAAGAPGSGADTQIYTSADGAASWTPVYTAPVNQLHALALTGTLVYAAGEGTDDRGLVVKSADSGTTWTSVFTGTGQQSGVFRALAVHPVVTTTVYAAGVELDATTYEGRGVVYRSSDGGLTWARVLTATSGCCWVDLYALALNPVTPTTVYAGGYESDVSSAYAVVYRSDDGGDHWTQALTATDGPSQQFTALLVHPITPTMVFAGSQNPKFVYRSIDDGLSWTKVLTDNGFRLVIDPPSTLYAADDWREVYGSVANGEAGTWAKVGGDTPGDIRSLAIDLAPTPGALYLGFRVEGVFKSTDGGLSWLSHNQDIESPLEPRDISVDPQDRSRLFVSAGCGGGWTSADAGQTWTQAPIAECVGVFALHPADASVVYAGVASDARGAILRSGDSGATFAPVYTSPVIAGGGSARVDALEIALSDPSTVYAGGQDVPAGQDPYGTVVRSPDGGLSWTAVLTLPNASVDVLAISPISDSVAYAGGEDCDGGPCAGFVYRTSNGGALWIPILMRTTGVNAIIVDPQKPDVLYASDDNTVLKSTDGGDTWVVVQSYAETNLNLLVIDPRVPSYLTLGGPGYIATTADGGRTWSNWSAPINQGTSGRSATALAVDGGVVTQTLYAGLGGVWHYTRLSPQAGRPVTVTASASALRAPADASVTIRGLVVDRHENWVSDGTVVTFTSSPEGSFGSVITRTTISGAAEATLAGVEAGTATVTVSVGTTSDVITVTFAPPSFISERVVGGLSQPTAIDWAPDGRMFIAQQGGRVRVFQNGELLPTAFIDLSAEVNNNWNRGMLGIAVHPDFPTSPYVYLLYTYDPPDLPGGPSTVAGPDGWGSRVSRLVRVSAYLTDTNVADPSSITVLLGQNSTLANIGDPADAGGEGGIPACEDSGSPVQDCLPSEGPSHSIGTVTFGHDGSLFVSNGEGAPYITPDPRAVRSQDLDSLGGKILRIHPETGDGYADNPFYDGDPTHNRSKVWSYGLRNPFRFALDLVTNTVYVGDVGWFSWEEVNTGRAENFGWPCYEGGDAGNFRHPSYQWYTPTLGTCSGFYDAEPNNGVRAPVYSYPNPGSESGGATVVLGAFYTGTVYPDEYQNALFIADYGQNLIRYLTFDESGSATAHDFMANVSSLGAPVHLTLGPDMHLYYVALNSDPSGGSEIRRILYTHGPSAVASAAPTDGYAPLEVQFSSEGSSDPNQAASELAYEWNFGDGVTSSLPNPAHTYTETGLYTAILTVTNAYGRTGSDQVVVTVGNLAPTVTITSPAPGSTYTMSSTVLFDGSATDADDGPLPDASLEWNARLYFNGHFHPAFFHASGVSEGSLVVPNHNDNTTVWVCLTAKDSGGLQGEDCVEIVPNTVVYTFESIPSGLQLGYDGIYYTTPFAVEVIVNAQRTIAAPPVQGEDVFISWSDGGEASHAILVGDSDLTYVARYRWLVHLPLVRREDLVGP